MSRNVLKNIQYFILFRIFRVFKSSWFVLSMESGDVLINVDFPRFVYNCSYVSHLEFSWQASADHRNHWLPRKSAPREVPLLSRLCRPNFRPDQGQGGHQDSGKIPEGGDQQPVLRPPPGSPHESLRRVHHQQGAAAVSRDPLRQGDLLKDGLGLSEADFEEVTSTCNIIINCAASIDFNARLDAAIDSNIKGSLRMLELAKKTKSLEVFTHISTSYVNCNRTGFIK